MLMLQPARAPAHMDARPGVPQWHPFFRPPAHLFYSSAPVVSLSICPQLGGSKMAKWYRCVSAGRSFLWAAHGSNGSPMIDAQVAQRP